MISRLCELVGHEWGVQNYQFSSTAKCELCELEYRRTHIYSLYSHKTPSWDIWVISKQGTIFSVPIEVEDVPSELVDEMNPRVLSKL